MDKTITPGNPSARRAFWLIPDRFDTRQDKSSWLEMARRLAESGWNIRIVAARSSAQASDYAGLVYYVPTFNVPFFFRWITIWNSYRYLRETSRAGDIIIMNEDSLWVVPLLKKMERRFVHLDIRTVPVVLPGVKKWLDRLLFWRAPIRLFGRQAESYSFITEPLRQEFERQFGLGLTPYCIWQSGVNTELFKPEACDREPVSTTQVPDSEVHPFNLFYHGGLLKTRGIDLVLHGIAQTNFPFELRFTIVGDGPDREWLEKLTTDLGISHLVRFTGFVPYEQVVHALNQADCCICPLPDLPEWRVSSPLKVLEYLACEKPVILTPLAAHRDVAAELNSVTWTRDYSPAAFGDAIRFAWQSRNMDTSVLRAGRQYVTDNFEWAVQANKLERLLSNAIPA